MEALIRQNTKSTPYVHLDVMSKTYVIGGRSIPIDGEMFYKPILNWLERFGETESPGRMEFCFRFDFFNISSSKRILFILYRLVELQKMGWSPTVRWMYEKNDFDMLEIGQDYSHMIEELSFMFEEFDWERIKETEFLKLG